MSVIVALVSLSLTVFTYIGVSAPSLMLPPSGAGRALTLVSDA